MVESKIEMRLERKRRRIGGDSLVVVVAVLIESSF